MMDGIAVQIAAQTLQFANEGTLTERLTAAMRAVRAANGSSLFWMSWAEPNDDMRFRAAVAAVLLKSDAEDRRIIELSMRPLKAIAAMFSGVPIDVDAALAQTQDPECIPLMKLWHDSVKPT